MALSLCQLIYAYARLLHASKYFCFWPYGGCSIVLFIPLRVWLALSRIFCVSFLYHVNLEQFDHKIMQHLPKVSSLAALIAHPYITVHPVSVPCHDSSSVNKVPIMKELI